MRLDNDVCVPIARGFLRAACCVGVSSKSRVRTGTHSQQN
jgi:hypothetical protein